MLNFNIKKWEHHLRNLKQKQLESILFGENTDYIEGRIKEVGDIIADLKFLRWHYKNRRRKG